MKNQCRALVLTIKCMGSTFYYYSFLQDLERKATQWGLDLLRKRICRIMMMVAISIFFLTKFLQYLLKSCTVV